MLLNSFFTIDEMEVTNNGVSGRISLNPNHQIYRGHFPNNPVVPGVCLMTICKEMLAAALNTSLMLTEAKSLKFLGVVNPQLQPLLNVIIDVKQHDGENIQTHCQILDDNNVYYKAICTFQSKP